MWQIKAAFSGVFTFAVYLLGGWDVSLQALIYLIVIDYLTGIMRGAYEKKLNSQTGIFGILKKIGMLILVAVATIIDRVTGDSGMVRSLVVYYICANEGLSIIENIAALGVPIPAILTDRLEQLKGDNNNDTKSN